MKKRQITHLHNDDWPHVVMETLKLLQQVNAVVDVEFETCDKGLGRITDIGYCDARLSPMIEFTLVDDYERVVSVFEVTASMIYRISLSTMPDCGFGAKLYVGQD